MVSGRLAPDAAAEGNSGSPTWQAWKGRGTFGGLKLTEDGCSVATLRRGSEALAVLVCGWVDNLSDVSVQLGAAVEFGDFSFLEKFEAVCEGHSGFILSILFLGMADYKFDGRRQTADGDLSPVAVSGRPSAVKL